MIPYRTFPSFDIGPVPIHTFGLFVAAGVFVGLQILGAHAARGGLDRERVIQLGVWTVIAGFIGARLSFVLSHLGDYTSRPWAVVAVWEGGLQFSGGFVLAAGTVAWWVRKHRDLPGRYLADGIALGLAAGLAFGRIGCYSVGEHLGGPTSFPLAVHYLGGVTREGPIAIGARIHNTALYEFLWLLPLIAVLARLSRRAAPGRTVVVFMAGYGALRFLTDFLRAYDRTVAGLTGAQWVSLAAIGAGIGLAARLRRRAPGGEAVAPGELRS